MLPLLSDMICLGEVSVLGDDGQKQHWRMQLFQMALLLLEISDDHAHIIQVSTLYFSSFVQNCNNFPFFPAAGDRPWAED